MILRILIAINAGLFAMALFADLGEFSAENGLIETMQVLLCAGALALFGFAATASRGPLQTASVMLTMVLAIALYREIDFRTMPGTDTLHLLSESWFRDGLVSILIVGVLAYGWFNREHFHGWNELLFHRRSLPLWVGGGLLATSIVLDIGIRFYGSRIVEEVVELNGFLLIAFAAFTTAHQCLQERGETSENGARIERLQLMNKDLTYALKQAELASRLRQNGQLELDILEPKRTPVIWPASKPRSPTTNN